MEGLIDSSSSPRIFTFCKLYKIILITVAKLDTKTYTKFTIALLC